MTDQEWTRVTDDTVQDLGHYEPTNLRLNCCDNGYVSLSNMTPTGACAYCGTEYELAFREVAADE